MLWSSILHIQSVHCLYGSMISFYNENFLIECFISCILNWKHYQFTPISCQLLKSFATYLVPDNKIRIIKLFKTLRLCFINYQISRNWDVEIKHNCHESFKKRAKLVAQSRTLAAVFNQTRAHSLEWNTLSILDQENKNWLYKEVSMNYDIKKSLAITHEMSNRKKWT